MKISEYIEEESGNLKTATAGLQNYVASNAVANDVRRGIVESMSIWRQIERLPYYLRHKWDMFFKDVADERDLPRNNIGRILIAVASRLFVLIMFAVSARSAILSSDPAFMGVFGLSREVSLVCLSAVPVLGFPLRALIFALYRNRLVESSGILICLVAVTIAIFYIGAACIIAIQGQQEAAIVVALSLALSAFVSVTGVIGIYYAMHAGWQYKGMADFAAVKIVSALKTHQKEDLLNLLGMPKDRFITLRDGKMADTSSLDGWNETYRQQKFEEMLNEGVDPSEISWKLEADPVLYIGNSNNRRLQVSRHDPTLTFVKTFPAVHVTR